MNYSKEQIFVAKAFALMGMIAHHLFSLPYRIYQESELISVLGTHSIHLERYLGLFGSVCGGMFLFLSGLGLGMRNKSFNKKALVSRLSAFYSTFLANFIILIPITYFWAPPLSEAIQYWEGVSLDPITFLQNFLLLNPSYSLEWWYARLYLASILVVWPCCEWAARKQQPKQLFLISALLFSFSSFVPSPDGFLYHQFLFVSGFLASRYKNSDYGKLIAKPLQGSPREIIRTSLILLLACYGAKPYFGEGWEVFLAPVICISTMGLGYWQPLRSVFRVIGEHSANMWLNHTFICYYWLHKPIYGLKFTPLIFLTVLVASFLISCGTRPVVLMFKKIFMHCIAKVFPEDPPLKSEKRATVILASK